MNVSLSHPPLQKDPYIYTKMHSCICLQLPKFVKSFLAGFCTSGKFKHWTLTDLTNTHRGRAPRTSLLVGSDQTLTTALSGNGLWPPPHPAAAGSACAQTQQRCGAAPSPDASPEHTGPQPGPRQPGARPRSAPPAPRYLQLLCLALLQELLEAEGVLCHHRHGHLPLTAPSRRQPEPPPLRRRPRRDATSVSSSTHFRPRPKAREPL